MPAARKTRRRPAKNEIEFYHVRVSGWEGSYHFGLADARYEPGPYLEFGEVAFLGQIAMPERFRYPNARVMLSGRRELPTDGRSEPPPSIGFMSVSGQQELQIYATVPMDMLSTLASVAASGRVRIVTVTGTRMRYRKASVHSVSVHTEDDDEDGAV